MIGYALVAFVLMAAGAAVGAVLLVSLGIRREEKANSLTIGSPGWLASGARLANGVYARRPGATAAYYADPRQDDRLALH